MTSTSKTTRKILSALASSASIAIAASGTFSMAASLVSPTSLSITATVTDGGGYFLDTYPNAAGGYSLRRLSSSYVGSVLNIRRLSDGVEVDVAFDGEESISLDSSVTVTSGVSLATNLGEFMASLGYLDADTLGASDSGYVKTLYDQSGEGINLSQSATWHQMQLVDSGVLNMLNGRPAILSRSDDLLSQNSEDLANTQVTILQVANYGTEDFIPFGGNGGEAYLAIGQNGSGNTQLFGADVDSLDLARVDGSVKSWVTRGDVYSDLNGSEQKLLSLVSTFNVNWSTVRGWGFNYTSYSFFRANTFFQELIIYKSNKTSDLAAMESNINSHYGAY